MLGYVYVITNETMPGLVKVGLTYRAPGNRAEELRHTGNAGVFDVAYQIQVDDPVRVEREAHKYLEDFHEDKEWFRCTVDAAVSALHQAAGVSSDPGLSSMGLARRSPGPMNQLSAEEQAIWQAYYRREREALARIGKGRDAAERNAWSDYVRQEIRAADDERAAAIRKVRDGK